MFSTELSFTLEAAYREASTRRHAFFCLEHLLYALLFDDTIIDIVSNCGGSIDDLRKNLEVFFDTQLEVVNERVPTDKIEPVQTPAVQRVFQKAIMHMHSTGKEFITSKELFVAILSENDSHAAYFIKKQGITRLDVLEYISHGVSKLPSSLQREEEEEDEEEELEPDFSPEEPEPDRSERRKSLLSSFTEDLTALARQHKLDPIIGRDREIERALRILSRRQKNNPLFLGDPGVGKTAMANAIAQRIAGGSVPASLKNARLFSLNVGSVIAGTKFRGEFEERVKRILNELTTIENPIIFIDEIHTIVGAGATGTGSLDVANLLKPALGSGKLRCIGSTTHEDYKKNFEKDRALSRRFSNIDLSEPSVKETMQILAGLKDRYEVHHKVKYSPAALKAAAELSARHINDRFLPDKAIDVIDEAGAANNLLPDRKRKRLVTEKEIEQVVSTIARVPVRSVSDEDEQTLRGLELRLTQHVYGQEKAVTVVAAAIKRSRASLQQMNKPVGCFLFAGPTGVGKTELAKALAHELGIQFHRFDMSEYMEKHAVARLIGAPPGYVGYEDGGLLTDLVRKHPYAVLLLDEIEKAHEDIYNILLQVMDNASLTDSHGRKADFRNIVLIMTTNAGSEKSSSIGFGISRQEGNRDQAVRRLFRPEFRNRLDEIVYFHALPIEVVERIVDKFVHELEGQLQERSVTFALSAPARRWLAEKGFDQLLGARPMARLIQREIKDPLADEILFGRLKKGGEVSIGLAGEKLTFKF